MEKNGLDISYELLLLRLDNAVWTASHHNHYAWLEDVYVELQHIVRAPYYCAARLVRRVLDPRLGVLDVRVEPLWRRGSPVPTKKPDQLGRLQQLQEIERRSNYHTARRRRKESVARQQCQADWDLWKQKHPKSPWTVNKELNRED